MISPGLPCVHFARRTGTEDYRESGADEYDEDGDFENRRDVFKPAKPFVR